MATVLAHDMQGNRTGITRPGGRVWTYAYNADGGVAQKHDPDGRQTSYVYDAMDRLVTETVDNAGPMPSADVYPWQLGIGMTKYYYDGAVPEDNAGTSHANRVPPLLRKGKCLSLQTSKRV